jgi:mannose-1-phosphate guanylyltransferase/mannose-1-phosphate guanylyltransferase/mannose-6-phosphate isomerase
MAGGSGTRLWPASSSRKPKQFLPVAGSGTETFFSQSLERALRIVTENDGRVIVIAGKHHLPFVISICSTLNSDEKKRLVLIPEPEAKNTAPAIACAVAYARNTGGKDRTMLVLTSDHIIKPFEVFQKDLAISTQFAAQNKLVVFGIPPTGPKTGYGYIETTEKLVENVYAVTAFREKPDLKTAEQFLASGKYFWNSGMFAFGCDFLAEEYHRLATGISRPFEQLNPPDKKAYTKTKGLCVLDAWVGLEQAYNQVERISFDYAIAEKCTQTVMVRAAFDWVDVGSWDEYARLLSGASFGNNDTGTEIYVAGTEGSCFVDSDIPVALAGVDDLIVVIRSGKDGLPPVALITKKGQTQLVMNIVEEIKQKGRIEIL